MQRRFRHAATAVAGIATVSLLAACGGGSSAAGGGSGSGGGGTELTYQDAQGNCAAEPLEGVDYQGAHDYVASFQQKSTGLLQTEPLPQPIAPGTTAVYLNNATPVSGIMLDALTKAGAAAGVEIVNVDTGTDAQSINSALNSVVELKPDILVSVALDATFFQDQLKALEDAGTAIVYASQTNAEEFGLDDTMGGLNVSQVNGKVLADGAIDFTCGTATNFVFYNIPEFGFAQVQLEAAEAQLAERCEECELRVVDISITDPSPADKIVSDLQANPDTQYFITPADQFQIGLAEKAQLAGITNAQGFGQSSLPPNIQQLVDERQSAGFAVDLDIFLWYLLDEGLRKMQGVWTPWSDWEAVGRSVSQVLTPANAGDYLNGFSANPNKEQDFKALWGK
jgi:ABC-type sugar transport system substrate-binding protein